MNLKEFHSVVFEDRELSISKKDFECIEKGFLFLQDFSKKKLIYGINTGFGPMAQYRIEEDKLKEVQINLIRSHCTGAGVALSPMEVKAIMTSRINTFLQGYSGVHRELIEILQTFINKNITPITFEHGSVGASGDLVQLAHIALCLTGEGSVIFEGKEQSTKAVLKKLNIKPLKIHIREALAITNGTSAMTGIGLINLIYAKKLIEISIILSCLINEVSSAFDDYFSEELNGAKQHKGQKKVAFEIRKILKTSKSIRKREEHFYNKETKEKYINTKVQEYYSLRCVPQILGPILDEITNTEKVLIDELNSACDNPIIDVRTKNIYHGGNFHGDYVAFQMDKLKIAITKLTMLAERQLNYLCNNRLNNILPPFINLGTLGFNYGMQAAQFTATSTTAECQTLSNPMYIHSIPSNNDNQDIVSMGTNASLMTKKVIENAFQVLSIHSIALVQAVDYLDIEKNLSDKTRSFYNKIRNIVPVFAEDSPMNLAIKDIVELLKTKMDL